VVGSTGIVADSHGEALSHSQTKLAYRFDVPIKISSQAGSEVNMPFFIVSNPSSRPLFSSASVSATMGLPIRQLFFAVCAAGLVAALPSNSWNLNDRRYVLETGGIAYTVFEHDTTATKLSYVKNSGICETTQGVNQYSGYLSAGTT